MREHIQRFAERASDYLLDCREYPVPDAGQGPRIIAHRGAWDEVKFRENTLDAFHEAARVGVYGIEFDVRFTRDGVPIVLHDPGLARMFKHPGLVQELTLAELRG